MKTIRRLYFYAVAFISIEVVLWGTVGLLRSIFNPNIVGGSSTLATALSAILVGVPIFLVHWLWAQWTSAKDDEEKTASLRAVFFYGILLATCIPAVQNLLALINRTFLSTANLYVERAVVGGSQTWSDNFIAIVINLLIAAYFWSVLRSEWRTLPMQEDFSDIRRIYRFVWMLYGLMMIVYGAQQALDYALTLSTVTVLGEMGRETAVNAIALLVVGSPIWYFSWRVLQEALSDSAEKESPLRLGVLYLLALGGVITVLSTGGSLLYTLLLQLFGAGVSGIEFLQKIAGPISIGIPFAVIWAYYGKWLNQQFDFEENSMRRAAKKRLYFYILALIGLAVVFFGVASLVSLVIDQVSRQEYLSNGGFRIPLASSISALIIGIPLWLLTWRPMQAEALGADALGDDARRSVIRKTYLYLVIFAAVIGGMGFAGTLLYTLFFRMLGGESGDFGHTLVNDLQVFILFVILLLYHLWALRDDGSVNAGEIEAKQSQFNVLVFDHTGKFGESVKSAFAKYAPRIPVTVVKATDQLPGDSKAQALVISSSLAVNTPQDLEAWMRSFNGTKLIVPDDAAGIYWMNDFEAAAESARILAEGQELRPQSANRLTSAWTYIAYVFAALFACQLLIGLIALGVSMVTGF